MQSYGKCKNADCGEEVFAPNWFCKTGRKHVVDSKTYYKDDAPTDPGARMPGTYIPIGQPLKDSKTLVLNMIPERREQRGHEVALIPGINAEFVRGQYQTTDPEMQYWCDDHASRGGCCTYERWEEVYLTPTQRGEMQRMKLEADNKRLEQERNELLAQIKGKRQSVSA